MIPNLGTYDNLIILLYFFILAVIVILVYRSKTNTSEDYFLGGRSFGWFSIGISLFATNISSEHIVGLAGSASSRGLAVGQFEWMAIFILLFLGWVLAPLFLKAGVITLPEFLGERYDKRTRQILATISIIAYIITKISITLFASGLLLREVFGWDLYTSSVIMVLTAGVYTLIGGMRTVVYTQIFQGVIIILGSSLVTYFGFVEVGGLSGLTSRLSPEYFHVLKPATDPDFPWTGIILGAPILAIWYWCTDQYIVQRILGASSIDNARKGTIFAASLKILPVFIFVLPGLIAAALFPEIRGDEAYTTLLNSGIIPEGIKGLAIAGVIAALMSSLSSVFNSTSALFVNDFYKLRNPDASEEKLVLIARLSTVITILIAILWVPLVKLISSNLYIYLQKIQSYISPPIAAIFILGFIWKKANSAGSNATLIIGGLISLLFLTVEFAGKEYVSSIPVIKEIFGMNYLYLAVILFFISVVIMVVVSTFAGGEKYSEEWDEKYHVKFQEILLFTPLYKVLRYRKNRSEVIFSIFIVIAAITFWSLF